VLSFPGQCKAGCHRGPSTRDHGATGARHGVAPAYRSNRTTCRAWQILCGPRIARAFLRPSSRRKCAQATRTWRRRANAPEGVRSRARGFRFRSHEREAGRGRLLYDSNIHYVNVMLWNHPYRANTGKSSEGVRSRRTSATFLPCGEPETA